MSRWRRFIVAIEQWVCGLGGHRRLMFDPQPRANGLITWNEERWRCTCCGKLLPRGTTVIGIGG